jgi:hypothetical protein
MHLQLRYGGEKGTYELHFFIMVKGMPRRCSSIVFGDWLSARVALDIIEDAQNIESVKDVTGECVNHGYKKSSKVDV